MGHRVQNLSQARNVTAGNAEQQSPKGKLASEEHLLFSESAEKTKGSITVEYRVHPWMGGVVSYVAIR